MTDHNFTIFESELNHIYSCYLPGDRIDLKKIAKNLIWEEIASFSIFQDDIVYLKLNETFHRCRIKLVEALESSEYGYEIKSIDNENIEIPEKLRSLIINEYSFFISERFLFNVDTCEDKVVLCLKEIYLEYEAFKLPLNPILTIYQDGVMIIEYRVYIQDVEINNEDFINYLVNMGFQEILKVEAGFSLICYSSIASNYIYCDSLYSKLLNNFKGYKHKKSIRSYLNNTRSEFLTLPKRVGLKEKLSTLSLTYFEIVYYFDERYKFNIRAKNKRKFNDDIFWSGRPYVNLINFKHKQSNSIRNANFHYSDFVKILSRAYVESDNIQFANLPVDLRFFNDTSMYISESCYLCVVSDKIDDYELINHSVNNSAIIKYLEYGYMAHKSLLSKINYSNIVEDSFKLKVVLNSLEMIHENAFHGETRAVLINGWKTFGVNDLRRKIDETLKVDLDYKNYNYQKYNNKLNRILTILFGFLAIPTLAKEVVKPIWFFSGYHYPKDDNLTIIISLLISIFLVIFLFLFLSSFFLFRRK